MTKKPSAFRQRPHSKFFASYRSGRIPAGNLRQNSGGFVCSYFKFPARFPPEFWYLIFECGHCLRVPVHFLKSPHNSGRNEAGNLKKLHMSPPEFLPKLWARILPGLYEANILYVYGQPKGARTHPEIAT